MTTTVMQRSVVASTGGMDGMGGTVVSEPSLQSPAVQSPAVQPSLTSSGAGSPGAGSPGASSGLLRPPTLFGQCSSWELVERGYALACRAVGYALEAVKVPEAVDALIAEGDRDALEMAQDYLAYTHFATPRSEQVAALFLIEDALYKLDRQQRGHWPVGTTMSMRIERARASLRDWLHKMRQGIRSRRPHRA
jgi:hypothetical protein